MSGFREQEATHLLWSNVRFNSNIIEMRWKPQFNWTPKAYKEREVPVPNELLELLETHRRSLPAPRASAEALVFSTASGRRDTHMHRALKRNAKKAGLIPDDFWLLKFGGGTSGRRRRNALRLGRHGSLLRASRAGAGLFATGDGIRSARRLE